MPKVLVTLDGVPVREVEITQPRTTVGRRPYNDIVVDALSVSGEHAVLELMGGVVLLEDLDSTNGTRINGKRTKLAQLRHGDVVEIGKCQLKFVDDRQGGDQASRPIELSASATRPAVLGAGGAPASARVRVMAGPREGEEVALVKIVTTFGKPGQSVVAIAARRQGHVLNPIEGTPALVNGAPASEPVPLSDRDVIELSGIQMQFLLN